MNSTYNTLEEAVKDAVNEYPNSQFSAYDITKFLRDKHSALEITTISDCGLALDSNLRAYMEIPHTRVKEYVEALNLPVQFNGTYRVFDKVLPVVAANPTAAAQVTPVNTKYSSDLKYSITYNNKLFFTNKGRAFWRRRNDATAAFGRWFFAGDSTFRSSRERKKALKALEESGMLIVEG